MENLKQEDEGSYKCILNNGGEDVEHEFNIYVTGERETFFPFRYQQHTEDNVPSAQAIPLRFVLPEGREQTRKETSSLSVKKSEKRQEKSLLAALKQERDGFVG